MIELLRPWALLLLPLPYIAWRMLPVLEARTSLIVPERLKAQLAASTEGSSYNLRMRRLRLVVALGGFLMLVLALGAPITEDEPLQLSSGRDLLLAVDLSASMTVKDVVLDGRAVDRFTAVKSLAGSFIERREGDRVGLIVFADKTYLVAPLTFDVRSVTAFLDEVVVGLPGKKTAVGDAIGLGIKTLQRQPRAARVIVLLSDGDHNAGIIVPDDAAKLALAHDVRIHTIGFGRSTAEAVTHDSLAELASSTGGSHHVAVTTRALGDVYERLDELEPTETVSGGQRVERDWVQECLIMALLCLIVLTFLDRREGRL